MKLTIILGNNTYTKFIGECPFHPGATFELEESIKNDFRFVCSYRDKVYCGKPLPAMGHDTCTNKDVGISFIKDMSESELVDLIKEENLITEATRKRAIHQLLYRIERIINYSISWK